MSSNDHGPESETTDASADQIAVDSSVGSNTDTEGPSKSEVTPKDGQDQLTNKHHVRSDSIKKPTTFKAVSVTKNFLAKAGTPTAAAPKTNGDNGRLEYLRIFCLMADRSSYTYSQRRNSHASSTPT